MVINIQTNRSLIYKQYLTVVNPLLGDNKLTNSEIDIFAKFLIYKDVYKNLDEDSLETVLFSSKTKKKIRDEVNKEGEVNITEAFFNNIILSLRKKEFIIGKKLKNLPSISEKGITITFNLILINEGN